MNTTQSNTSSQQTTTMGEALNTAIFNNPNGSVWGPEVGTN